MMHLTQKISNILNLLFLAVACSSLSILLYIRKTWPNADYEQILITLNELSFDTIINNASVADYFYAVIFFAIIYPLCYFCLNAKQQFFTAVAFTVSFLWLSGFFSYHFYKNTTSTLFEEEYINPRSITYTFPSKKRNLVLIYLESFEQNFSKAEHYGKNLIPYLTQLRKNAAYSSAHNNISGTNFSITSLVSSECGVPLRYLPNEDIYATKYFLPQAVCFPEILKENGYQTAIIKAADIKFTRTHIFAKSHGYDQADGVNEIRPTYPEELHKDLNGTFGGINDEALFSYAKKRLREFSPDKPFMLTLFSLDTHTPTPYYNPKCQKNFGDIRDVYMCTDKTVYDFVEWLKQSPYWENTTVVIVGDHLLSIRLDTKGQPRRGIYNAFINIPRGLNISKEKEFSTYDLAPSILESLDIKLSTRAFGLGRSLFSEEPTLIQKLGLKNFNIRLLQKSEMYNQFNKPLHQRISHFQPYTLGVTLTNSDLLKYTDAYERFLDTYYMDRFNMKISENIENNIHVALTFNAILNFKSAIHITVNDYNVSTFTPDDKINFPQIVSFDIPAALIDDGKLQFKFRNTAGVNTPIQMGIAPLEFKLTAE